MNVQGMPFVTPGPAAARMNSAASNNSGATLDPHSAEETFMTMLITELQSQDPTSPMDPAAMVGQMFSMNQLQQLIQINQTLSYALGAPYSTSAASHAATHPSNTATSRVHATLPTNTAASYAQQLLTGAH
jgi:flagellar basal-body rod modification protein FlgD